MAELTKGKVITVRGEVEPDVLGAVMMHEHLHSACRQWEEGPTVPEREKLIMEYGAPAMKQLHDHGCHAYVDCTPRPWRAWPDTYLKVADATDIHMILATGYYREMEVGSYWIKTEADAIWPVVRQKSAEELAEMCVEEITEGIHGSSVRAGVIKLGSSRGLTDIERKAFRAGALAQKQTGVSITTHCTTPDTHNAQLGALDQDGVDLSRVTIGHTASHMVNEPDSVREWMKRGATFLPTNLRMDMSWEFYPDLVNAIHECFQQGLGEHIVLGLDWAFEDERGPFVPCSFMPPPPYVYMFAYTLPRLRKLGLSEEEEKQIMVKNPARILPVQ